MKPQTRLYRPAHILRSALLALIGAFFMSALSVEAQTPAMGQPVPLTSEIVGNFVAGYPVVKERLETYSDDFAAPEGNSPADAMAAYLTYQQASGELDALVGEYGFENFMAWVQTTSSIVTAYTFAREGGGMDEQMQQAIAQVENNPNLTAEQKQAMIDQMSAAMQSMTALRTDQASLDAVAAYRDQLAVIFEDE